MCFWILCYTFVLGIVRDLRWGRVGETFGEAPYLIASLATAMLQGYQGDSLSGDDSILACGKHFIGYSDTQGGRDSSEADHSERKLRTLFLPPFQKLIDAGSQSLMVGYQAIDGIPCTINKWLLNDVLRSELAYEGLLVTDWDNVKRLHTEQMVCADMTEAVKLTLEASVDLLMGTEEYTDIISDLVRSGKVAESVLDEACRRILRQKFELGLFDKRRYVNIDESALILDPMHNHRQLALDVALESCVLLKNDNDTLPIPASVKHVAVLGANADDVYAQMGDWVLGTFDIHTEKQNPDNIMTVLDALKARSDGSSLVIRYAKGCDLYDDEITDTDVISDLVAWADFVVIVLGDDVSHNGEMCDRANLDISSAQLQLFEMVHDSNKPHVVVLINGKPLTIPTIAEKADAILEAWNPGCEGGTAIEQILFGDVNPSGKLTVSFPHHVGQIPVVYNQKPGWHGTPPRYVDMPQESLYAFGYGLSYTQFEYRNLQIQSVLDEVVITVDVTNIGDRDGTEIVQVYVNDVYTSVTTPMQQLIAYQRVFIQAQETLTLTFRIHRDRLKVLNREMEWVFEAGEFDFMVGGSSRIADLIIQRVWLN